MTRVKICGLRDPQDARLARDAGADMLGVIFAESPRRASLGQARAIRAALGPRIELFEADADAFGAAIDAAGRPLLVGVFARQSADEIVRIAAEVDLDAIQLSGGEHAELVARLPRPVIRVHHVDAGADPDALLVQVARGPATITALDTYSAQGGGSGRTFDWAIAAAIARIRPIMLCGGLTPDNVAAAIERVRPWAVDVASGVERRSDADGRPAPGVKSPERVRAFIENVRAADDAGLAPMGDER
jgi:phosphoribosylanthranilate isomerase